MGQKVVYRDPRAKAVGGRTAWKEPLSDPCVVEEIRGNKVRLRRLDGTVLETAHLEDVAVIPDRARNLEMESRELFAEEQIVQRALIFALPSTIMFSFVLFLFSLIYGFD